MQKVATYLCLLLGFTHNIFSQEFNCEPHYKAYCEHLESDTNYLPVYTAGYFYSGSETDSNRTIIEDCIGDLDAFCNGVKEALESEKLAIRQVGDPSHVSSCSYYSYERWGVKLVMTGDIILDAGIFSENAGFNYIMKGRIKEQLGENYSQLGVKDSNWVELDNMLLSSFYPAVGLKRTSDTTMVFSIDSVKLSETKLEHMRGVMFKDYFADKEYTYEQVCEGVEVKTRTTGGSKAYLRVDFSNYEKEGMCAGYSSVWTIPLKLKEGP